MIRTLLTSHPTAETLSRLADQDELSRARSRAGRHVARCAECQAVVGEYDALGAAARAMPGETLPERLRDRVLDVARDFDDTRPVHAAATPARRPRRLRALAALAAGVLLAALGWPLLRRHDLFAAADAEPLTIAPRYPRPGMTVRIRFVPPPRMPAADTLWIEGSFRVTDAGAGSWRDEVPVAAPLLRSGDAYAGTLAVPANALAGSLHLLDPHWPPHRYKQLANALLLTAVPAGSRPSVAALEEGVEGWSFWQVRPQLAAEFARWEPDHPMRWLLEPRRSRGALDWLGFFTSKERRFSQLTVRLNGRKSATAGELAGMAALAYDIEEPEAAAQWTERLVREHPESPWALEMRAQQIHALELRSAPHDSVAMLMPSLDSLLAVSPHAPGDPWTFEGVIERNGDAAMLRRWTLRMAHFGARSTDLLGRQAQLRDLQIRDSVESGARETVAELANSPGPRARMDRALAYGQLASVALARGEYRRAIALTDSSRSPPCRWVGRDTRGLAYLALGDTSNAQSNLLVYAKGDWGGADSVRRLLGARTNDPRWAQRVDSAWADERACVKREEARP